MSVQCNHDCSNCSKNCSSRTAQSNNMEFSIKTNENSRVKRVIGVISGKGGVGKSMVTSLLACQLAKAGRNVAILDADITGPSIPQAFGLHESLYADAHNQIIPAVSASGIKVVSTNLILEDEATPVLWRASIINGLVKQFYSEVNWGDVDYMLVDMPPGTSDVALTVFQSLPIEGIIIVATPQQLVSMIVEKAVRMAEKMNVPIIGLIENMSYIPCDECGNKVFLFGKGNTLKLAQQYELPLLAQLPLDPALAQLVDEGMIENYPLEPLKEIVDILEKMS